MTRFTGVPLTLRLARAIEQGLGVPLAIDQADSADWASATFTGATHRLVVAITGEPAEHEAERIAATIAEAHYDLRGHLVADIALTARNRHGDSILLTIEALTIVDA